MSYKDYSQAGARDGGRVYKSYYICIWFELEITLSQRKYHLWRKVGFGNWTHCGPTVDKLEKAWTDCDMYMRTMEPTRHTKTRLSLTSFRLTIMGELQKFAIKDKDKENMVKDKENMSKRSGGRSRSCESTISWTIRPAATLWVAIVSGALNQPTEPRNMTASSQVPPKSYINLFHGQP